MKFENEIDVLILKDAFRTFEHLTFEFQKSPTEEVFCGWGDRKKTVRLNGKSDLNGVRLNRTMLA